MEPAARTESTCYRHHDRRAGVRCQRCERPICPACMNTASVGFHCPDCARSGRQKVYTRANLNQANRPWLSQALIAVNVAVFAVGLAVDSASGLADSPGYSPVLDGSLELLARGGLNGPIVASGEWWRLLTSGFLHFGIIHLAFNMFALYRIGQILEPAIGKVRFGAAYVASLLVGSLGVLLVQPDGLTAGASGAIFGLFGLLFVFARARGIDPWASGIGMTIGLNLLITFSIPGISIGGHLGGLAGGLLCGYLLFVAGPRQQLDERAQLGAVAAVGLVAAMAGVLLA